jgi:hypothetical protein
LLSDFRNALPEGHARSIRYGFTQSPTCTVALVIGVKKAKFWHFDTAVGQSAPTSHGAVQYWACPTMTVCPWSHVEGSVVVVPGAFAPTGVGRQYFSTRSSVALSRTTQICPLGHERSPAHSRAQKPIGVPFTVTPLQRNAGSPQSVSLAHLVVHEPREPEQIPVLHVALGNRVPVHTAPMAAPAANGV